MKDLPVSSPSMKKGHQIPMEYSDSESEIGDPRLDTHKTSKSNAPQNRGSSPIITDYPQRYSNHTTSYHQKTEKAGTGTKQFVQASSLWTTNQQQSPQIEENLPDLMQDSDDHSTIHPSNSNLNNTLHQRVNTLGNNNNSNNQINIFKDISNQNPNYNNNNNNNNNKIQSQVLFQTSTLQTGVFRQLIPYNGSNLTNEVPTASFQPEEESIF